MQNIYELDKQYANIAEVRNIDYATVDQALMLVKNFIVKHKLIIYGGLAIDQALKMNKHKGIYTDDTLPDYDCKHYDYYNLSNQLATELYQAGFKNVSSINALHPGTRKIRVNFHTVCDMSYVPESIYNKSTYITVKSKDRYYDKLLITDPLYLRLDLYKAMCGLYFNAPQESYFQRFTKDTKRTIYLDTIYPVEAPHISYKLSTKHVELPIRTDATSVLTGHIQVCIYHKLIELFTDASDFPHLDIQITNNIKLTMPDWILDMPESNICLITRNYYKLLSKYCNIEQAISQKQLIMYNKYMDNIRYPLFIYGHLNIYYQDDQSVNCYKLADLIKYLTSNKPNKSKSLVQILERLVSLNITHISQGPYILMFYLQRYFETSDTHYISIYKLVQMQIIKMEQLLSQIKSEDFYSSMPFFISKHKYPEKHNIKRDTYAIRTMYDIICNTYKQEQTYKPPFGFYPNKLLTWPAFDVRSSIIFRIDGTQTHELPDSYKYFKVQCSKILNTEAFNTPITGTHELNQIQWQTN
jgi:hypothetical protein